MRIRKTASKVLGLSSSFLSPPPPAEDYHFADALPEELLLCQLNCSPWDVMELESNLHHFTFQEGGGGGDEGRGIMGNVFKFEGYDEILANAQESAAAAFTITSFGSTAADEAEKTKKRRRGRKRKEEVINVIIRDIDQDNKVATKNSSITLCKKNDGKGWQCKRPASLQHSLCNHHLGLLRNYSSRTNNRESYESETDRNHTIKNQRPKAAAAESAGDGFYYYSGFGPCRGKKRCGGGTSADHARPKEVGSEADEDDEEESDAPVAGDDIDDDTNEEEEDDDVENKGRYTKKGRKRVKARSLKSLM